jgi:prophage regulatory protein
MATELREALLRCRQVQALTGLGRSSLYLQISRGQFPAPYHIGARAVAWRSSEVQAWIDSRVRTRSTASGNGTVGEAA